MADNPYDKEGGSQNEYQFQDDQDIHEYKYEDKPVSETPASVSGKRRPIAMIVGIIIAIFVIYEIGHLLFRSKIKTIAPQSAVVSQPVIPVQQVTQKPAQMNNNLTGLNSSPVSQAPSPDQEALTDQLSKLQTSVQSLADSLDKQQFQNQTSTMSVQESINGLGDKLDQAVESLQALTAAEQTRQAQEQQAARDKIRQQAAYRKQKQYFVDAVIPGRAWLKAIDGSTITVALGQKVPGYGVVTLIDPYSGVVKTSTGIIPYGTTGA